MLPLAHMGITLLTVRAAERCFKWSWIDYRIVLAAAILPDLIDKPLGYLLPARHFLAGKNFGHSWTLLLVLLGIGLILRRKRNKAVMGMLCAGSAIHSLLDATWRHPGTLFWPLDVWQPLTKPRYDVWEDTIRLGGLKLSQLFTFEILGGIILLYFFICLAPKNKFLHFVKTGKFP